jgi:hypothetical protein
LDHVEGTGGSGRVGGGPGQGGILDDILDRLLVVAVCTTMVDAIFDEACDGSVQTGGAGEVIAPRLLYCRDYNSQIHVPLTQIPIPVVRMFGTSMAVSILAKVPHPEWRVLSPMWCCSCQLSTILPPHCVSTINAPTCDY